MIELLNGYRAALDAAVAAALEAGARLRLERARPDGPRGVGEHAEADEEVEEQILRPNLTARFPEWGYRGEETLPHRPPLDGAGHVWLVDPNDATAAYLRGLRGPAVSIALLRDGQPVLGVVYSYDYPDDRGDLLAWAEGEPFLRNGHPTGRQAEARPLAEGDVILLSESADARPEAFRPLVSPAGFLAIPSIAYRLALAAAGDGRAAMSLGGPGDWDYAAGHAMLRAVGGILIGGDGAPVTYRRDGLSTAAMGRVFGGDSAVVKELWPRDWTAVLRGSINPP